MQTPTNIFLDLVILIKLLAFAVIAVSSNLSFGTLSKAMISFFLLPKCAVEILSTSKLTTISPNSPFDEERIKPASNTIP